MGDSHVAEAGSLIAADGVDICELPLGPVATFPSNLGWMAVAWDGQRLKRVAFGYRSRGAVLRGLDGTDPILPPDSSQSVTPWLAHLVRRLQEFAEGIVDNFLDVEVDLRDRTRFQRAVLERCRQIPRGELLTYGQLAASIGSPGAARAVGNVMAGNRLPLIIPCHRVVGSAGNLGGFSAPDGIRLKKRLLKLEGSLL